MKTEFFIVTYAKDFQYLKFFLRSAEKFASGFSGITILVPTQDAAELAVLTGQYKGSVPVKCVSGDEWDGKGMLWHMASIMHADEWCPDADFIAHIDSDCVFTAPVTPETFIKDGKPILQYERFASIGHRHPGVLKWQENTVKCLPIDVLYETMRGHPEVYRHDTYALARRLIVQKTGVPVNIHIMNGRNAYPQDFCEFVTLGNVAMHVSADKYHLVDNEQKPNPDRSDFPIGQFWSHGSPDLVQEIWWNGRKENIIPSQKWKELGL